MEGVKAWRYRVCGHRGSGCEVVARAWCSSGTLSSLASCHTQKNIFADFAVCGRTLSGPQVCLNGPGESKEGKWAQHRVWGQLSAWFCAVR